MLGAFTSRFEQLAARRRWVCLAFLQLAALGRLFGPLDGCTPSGTDVWLAVLSVLPARTTREPAARAEKAAVAVRVALRAVAEKSAVAAPEALRVLAEKSAVAAPEALRVLAEKSAAAAPLSVATASLKPAKAVMTATSKRQTGAALGAH